MYVGFPGFHPFSPDVEDRGTHDATNDSQCTDSLYKV